MNYSREAFRAWLMTLPPDEPRDWRFGFFGASTCPIGEFMGCGCGDAFQLDSELTGEIDGCGWSKGKARPSQIIACIDKISPRKEKAKGIPKEIRSLFDGRVVRNPDREIA